MICAGGEAEIGNEREREREKREGGRDTNMQVSCSLSPS